MLNGSGLFAPNRVSAAQLTSCWRPCTAIPALRPEFVAQLAVAGVDGTLSKRFEQLPPAPRIVRAKTGTLDDVIALSGYVLGPNPGARVRVQRLANGVRGKQQARDASSADTRDAAEVRRMHLWLPRRSRPRPATA